MKLLENKNVGTRLGSTTNDETPSTSTNTGTKSKLKSGKIYVIVIYLSKVNLNNVLYPYVLFLEYNPLMGDSTRGYRPPKRSCCKKGGCG